MECRPRSGEERADRLEARDLREGRAGGEERERGDREARAERRDPRAGERVSEEREQGEPRDGRHEPQHGRGAPGHRLGCDRAQRLGERDAPPALEGQLQLGRDGEHVGARHGDHRRQHHAPWRAGDAPRRRPRPHAGRRCQRARAGEGEPEHERRGSRAPVKLHGVVRALLSAEREEPEQEARGPGREQLADRLAARRAGGEQREGDAPDQCDQRAGPEPFADHVAEVRGRPARRLQPMQPQDPRHRPFRAVHRQRAR